MDTIQRPQVGIGVIVKKDGKLLLGKRKGEHGKGTWCFPGGHLEMNESFEECAVRETYEETGITIGNLQKVTFINDIFSQTDKHYVTCYLKADYQSGDVRVMEPEKFEEWGWFAPEAFPQPLFLSVQNFLKEGRDLLGN